MQPTNEGKGGELAHQDIAELAHQINTAHAAVLEGVRATLHSARAVGELLLQAKELCPHGRWLPWLKDNVHFTERTAQGYMRVVREWDRLVPSNTQPVAYLSLKDALEVLAEPRPEPEPPPAATIPPPALVPGKAYCWHSFEPVRAWPPTAITLELAPTDRPDVWLYSVCWWVEESPERTAAWCDYSVRGARVRNPDSWAHLTRHFQGGGEWEEKEPEKLLSSFIVGDEAKRLSRERLFGRLERTESPLSLRFDRERFGDEAADCLLEQRGPVRMVEDFAG